MLTATIREKVDRIVIPEAVIEERIVDPDELVFWAYSEADDAAAISKHREPFLESEWFHPVSYSTLDSNRSITVPRQFFPRYDGPATSVPLFERGETVEFVLDDALAKRAVCLLRPFHDSGK
jgi:hypothetical protein